jgi:hypothetical protein
MIAVDKSSFESLCKAWPCVRQTKKQYLVVRIAPDPMHLNLAHRTVSCSVQATLLAPCQGEVHHPRTQGVR